MFSELQRSSLQLQKLLLVWCSSTPAVPAKKASDENRQAYVGLTLRWRCNHSADNLMASKPLTDHVEQARQFHFSLPKHFRLLKNLNKRFCEWICMHLKGLSGRYFMQTHKHTHKKLTGQGSEARRLAIERLGLGMFKLHFLSTSGSSVTSCWAKPCAQVVKMLSSSSSFLAMLADWLLQCSKGISLLVESSRNCRAPRGTWGGLEVLTLGYLSASSEGEGWLSPG